MAELENSTRSPSRGGTPLTPTAKRAAVLGELPRSWLGACLLVLPGLLSTACQQIADPAPDAESLFGAEHGDEKSAPKPIQELIAGAFTFNDFEALLVASGAASEMKSPPYTVFIPWNAAFDRLPPYWAQIKAQPGAWRAHLRQMANAHIHSGLVPATQLEDAALPMWDGTTAGMQVKSSRRTIDGISVIATMAAADGYAYAIDRVRLPAWARRTALDVVNTDPRFSILKSLLTPADRGRLAAAEGLTLFAPTNEAFGVDGPGARLPGAVDIDVEDYIVQGPMPHAYTPKGSRVALSGTTIRWDIDAGSGKRTIQCTPVNGVPFPRVGVGASEELANNGIVHPIGNLACSNALRQVGSFPRAPFTTRVAFIMSGEHSPEQIETVRRQSDPQYHGLFDFMTDNSAGFEDFEGDVFGPYPYSDCFQPANVKNDCKNLRGPALRLAAAEWAGLPAGVCPDDVSDETVEAFKDEYLVAVHSLIYDEDTCGAFSPALSGYAGNTTRNTWSTFVHHRPDAYGQDWLFAHEFGHAIGLSHSRSVRCDMSSGTDVSGGDVLANHCGPTRYVTKHSFMGGAGVIVGQHVAAPHKSYMGWLRNCEDVTAGGGRATYRLSPIDGQCGLRSVKVKVPGTENTYYYVEHRSPDAGYYSGFRLDKDEPTRKAVLVQLSDESVPRNLVYSMSPSTGFVDRDAPLGVGKTYTLPGGVSIRLVGFEEDTDTAIVEVTSPLPSSAATCLDGTALTKNRDDAYDVQCGSR